MLTTSTSTRVRPEDVSFYEREIASFIPDRVFDAHGHLWQADNMDHPGVPGLPRDVGYSEYMDLMRDIHPGRAVGALLLHRVVPRPALAAANEWTSRNIANDADCRGLLMVPPEADPEWVRREVRRLNLHGLKVYHVFADHVDPTYEAQIPDYLPEPLIKVADEEGWVITLHMVRDRACADPQNIHWIRHYCQQYPNMKLILAHSARAFQPGHALEGLPQLTGLDNLWFDTSANCEPMAHQAIIRIIGHEKLMYGTDCPASHHRGRSVGVEDTFVWLTEHTPVWNQPQMSIKPVLIGLEHLRSLKWACWAEHVSDSQIEDIFWNNAARLFGIR